MFLKKYFHTCDAYKSTQTLQDFALHLPSMLCLSASPTCGECQNFKIVFCILESGQVYKIIYSELPFSLFFGQGRCYFLWKCFHLTSVNNLSTFSTAPHNYQDDQWTLQINFSCTSYEEFLSSSLLCNSFHSTPNSWWIFSWATWLNSVVEFQVFQSLANPQQ